VLESFHVVEDKDCAVPRGKLSDRLVERNAIHEAGTFTGGEEQVLHLSNLPLFRRLFETDALLAEVHQDVIDGQPVQPRGEGGLTAEASYLAKELNKDILGQIFRFRRVGDHAEAEAVDPSVVSLIEQFKGPHIAGGRRLRQIVIGRRFVGHLGRHVGLPTRGRASHNPVEVLNLRDEIHTGIDPISSIQLFAA